VTSELALVSSEHFEHFEHFQVSKQAYLESVQNHPVASLKMMDLVLENGM
jgi:hypothetical protein